MKHRTTRRGDLRGTHAAPRGITIVEMLAVIGVIAVLVAILLPAISLARRNALWGTSQANLRQVGQLLTLYATENREAIVPTAFDYRTFPSPGKVRSASPQGALPPIGPVNYGSWTDVLWTVGKFGPVASTAADTSTPQWDYRFDSPDAALYERGYSGSDPFRSAEVLVKPTGGDGASPFGTGATEAEAGAPGYFGGNPFFDARPIAGSVYQGRFWTTGQIKRPEASMYCCDSNLGELLGLNDQTLSPNNAALDLTGVEWRYSGQNALMLFLDGHVDTVGEWEGLRELEKDLGVRVLGLDRNSFFTNGG